MASGSSPILGVWVDASARKKPVEQVAQWTDLAIALGSILTSVKRNR